VVLVTSKTLAEVSALSAALGLDHPVVAENGALVAVPPGYFGTDDSPLLRLSPTYEQLCQWLWQLRQTKGYRFTGFCDMDNADVAKHTGLSTEDAALARQREGSEPFMWEDSETALAAFMEDVKAQGWRCVQGGRFWHLLGDTDKAQAAHHVLSRYRETIDCHLETVALGDSPNDLPLFHVASIAVVIRRHDGTWMDVDVPGRTIQTNGIGPIGWNEAIGSILTELEATHV
ncbi:MAG TPA: mannosyl-3-phosphoglycerate phosphatase-related protein, partial [Gammaproteobacteria bacterium]|nr:mannosyl-3-phosphoglycerate phosphatase-related protein [Gammaproteobacteria bacterium]